MSWTGGAVEESFAGWRVGSVRHLGTDLILDAASTNVEGHQIQAPGSWGATPAISRAHVKGSNMSLLMIQGPNVRNCTMH